LLLLEQEIGDGLYNGFFYMLWCLQPCRVDDVRLSAVDNSAWNVYEHEQSLVSVKLNTNCKT